MKKYDEFWMWEPTDNIYVHCLVTKEKFYVNGEEL